MSTPLRLQQAKHQRKEEAVEERKVVVVSAAVSAAATSSATAEGKVPGTPTPRASVSARKMNQGKHVKDVKEGESKVVEEVKDAEEGKVVT